MKTKFVTIEEILNGEPTPIPLDLIPNRMGINLCSVDGISYTKQNDDQLVSVTIHFIPEEKQC